MDREVVLQLVTDWYFALLFVIIAVVPTTAWKIFCAMQRLGDSPAQWLLIWGTTLPSLGWGLMVAGVVPAEATHLDPGVRLMCVMVGLTITAVGKVVMAIGSWMFDRDLESGLLGR